VADASEIDRLVDEGLKLYGGGDIDGALLSWEQALAIDPGNPQASSYVDYVRQNYELLTGSEPTVDDGADTPFAIEEEPEYQIEILPGELPQAAPLHMDELDQGWFIEEAPTRDAISVGASLSLPNTTLELDAEEPSGVSFEDATREYHGPAAEFTSGQTTSGFSQESTTDVRKRDLGFVQPVAPGPDAEEGALTPPAGVNVKLRTPDIPMELGAAGRGDRPSKKSLDEDDLIASLPSPRQPGLSGIDPTAPTREIPMFKSTRDMPSPSRPPANRDLSAVSQAEVMLPHAKTEDLDHLRRGQFTDPLVSAPTRELGIRPAAAAAAAPEPAKPAPVAPEGTRHDIVLPFDPIDARTQQILEDVDETAPPDEVKEDKTRRRITTLFEKALEWSAAGELDKAVAAVDLAMSEDPNSALAQKLLHRHRDETMQVFQSFLGDLSRQPQLARPLHELASAPISPRAAFLLSRIDGMISIDEILDVSGMPRLEAYRHLCQLFLRGILR